MPLQTPNATAVLAPPNKALQQTRLQLAAIGFWHTGQVALTARGAVRRPAERRSVRQLRGWSVDISETLVGIAQLSVALAGFAGVALALSSGAIRSPSDQHRIWLLLGLSLPQIPFALLPIVVLNWSASPKLAWQIISVPMLVYWLVFLVLIVRRVRRHAEHEELPIMHRRSWSAVVTPASLAVAGLLCLNVVGWPFGPGPAAYLLALIWGLSWGAAVFADLVFVRPGPR